MSYEQIKIATQVDVRKQVPSSQYVSFDGAENTGLRVMFVGNSITLHEVNEGIGWLNAWGMAASAKEKDYVHLCFDHIRQAHPNAKFCICQGGEWERNYKEGDSTLPLFASAREFEADVILIKLAGNCSWENFDSALFKQNYASLVKYLNKSGKARVVVASEFHHHPAEEALEAYTQEMDYPYVPLGDLGERPEMMALGLFEHEGVAHHPGDLGMQNIADRFCRAFDALALPGEK